MPLVSIIITSYNYGRFLSEAIDSALKQTYENVEVIVVDDGSEDNSREIISSYTGRIIPVLKENEGQASAFNSGFSVSKGDIIIFLDSDDKLSPNVAEEVVKVWHPGITKVHYRLQWIDAQGNLLNVYGPPAGTLLPSGDLKPKILTQGYYFTPPTSGNAFGREFLQAVMPIPEEEWHLYTDAYLHLYSPLYGNIAAIQECLGYYRVHGANASSSNGSESDKDRLVREIFLRSKRDSLLIKTANRMNLKATIDSTIIIAKKLALLLICPDHYLIKEESLTRLVLRGLRAIWRESDIPIWKQIAVSAYFISVPFIPRTLAKDLSLWYIYPESRPSFIKRIV
jgi:glycosyltransferase involved in cell wall biosynthesis